MTLKDPFSISNKIVECLRPDLDNQIEKKQLDEHDAIRKGEIMVKPMIRHKEPECIHENIDWDLENTQMLDKEIISIRIECTDCGKLGYGYWDFKEIEWGN